MTQIKGTDGSMNIELDGETAKGNYANLAVISHSITEFVVDFAAALPGMPRPKVVSRVILAPEHAKRLMLSLQENVTRYESNNGSIEIHQREATPTIYPVGEA